MEEAKRQQVGKRVKQLRGDLGWTQDHLGEQLGLTKYTISNIETGSHGISRIADRLAQALGTTTDYLYGLTDNPLPSNDEEEDERPPVNAARDALLAEYDRLDEIDQQVMYQMAITLRQAKERRKTTRVIE